MNKVLLIFDDSTEVKFLEANLAENNFEVLKSNNLADALILAKKTKPILIVINMLFEEDKIIEFCKKIKTEELKDISILSLVASENYYSTPFINHLMIKPIRPKLLLSIIRSLMINETVNWMPSIQ